MSRNNKLILFITVLTGLLVPFIPHVVIFEMFYLLIPFAIIFIITLIYLIVCIINKDLNSRKGFFIFSILPLFIISQFLSGFLVDKIQRLRSNQIISKVKKIKIETRQYPEKLTTNAGIEYYKTKREENFVIQYSRGFLVTEKYQSKYKHWKSYGWND